MEYLPQNDDTRTDDFSLRLSLDDRMSIADSLCGTWEVLANQCIPSAEERKIAYIKKSKESLARLALTLVRIGGENNLCGNIETITPYKRQLLSRSLSSRKWGESGDNGRVLMLLSDIIPHIHQSSLLDQPHVTDLDLWYIAEPELDPTAHQTLRHTKQFTYESEPFFDQDLSLAASTQFGQVETREYDGSRLLTHSEVLYATIEKTATLDDKTYITQEERFEYNRATGVASTRVSVSPATSRGHFLDGMQPDDLTDTLALITQRMAKDLPETHNIIDFLS